MTSHQGQIKNFITTKGYGFIASPEIEGDVYFQRRDLPEDLQINVGEDLFSLKGLGCFFESVLTKDGKPQARNVKVLGGDGANMLGSVKNYNPMKGYGFISSSMWEGDCYFKGKDLPPQLAATDVRGMKVRFTAVAMQDGKMQARDVIVLQSAVPAGPPPMQMSMPPMPTQRMAQPQVVAPAPQAQVQRAPPAPTMAAPPAAMGHTIPEGTSMVGSVKTFDPAKGYGFISAPNFPVDIYFKPELEPVAVGQQVTFTIHWTPQGKPQAREVTSPMQAGEVLSGTVRRYNPNKGFGFLAVEGRSQDVYFQKQNLPMEYQESTAMDGAQFQFSVIMSPAQKPQAQDMELIAMPGPNGAMAGKGGFAGVKRPAPTQVPARPSVPSAMPVMANPMVKRPRPMPTTVAPEPSFGAYGFQNSVQQLMAAAGLQPTLGVAAPSYADGKTRGTVKSFNPMKGFGFIAAPSLPTDVYFNAKSLDDAYRSLQLDGQQVAFNVRYTQDGKIQATDVQVGV